MSAYISLFLKLATIVVLFSSVSALADPDDKALKKSTLESCINNKLAQPHPNTVLSVAGVLESCKREYRQFLDSLPSEKYRTYEDLIREYIELELNNK